MRDRNDNYLFSHKSFFEYYFARYCVNSIEKDINDPCWSKKWFDKEIAAFITDIIKKDNKRHIIFYLFDVANHTTNPIIIWNVLHILSLLDIDDVGPFLTKDVTDKLLEKAETETNCVIIRQYCRIIAKFIDRPLAEQYIDKIIDIVQSDSPGSGFRLPLEMKGEPQYEYFQDCSEVCSQHLRTLRRHVH